MNERILELARQVWPDPNISHVNHMKFAELIVRECITAVNNTDRTHAYTTFDKQLIDGTIIRSVQSITEHFK